MIPLRTLLLAAATALLLATAMVPVGNAAHYGPCGHEYFEIVLYVAEGGSVKTAAGYAGNCATGNLYWVCQWLDCVIE